MYWLQLVCDLEPRSAAGCFSCVALQLSSMAGNLIGPELSPMRHSRPAVARRLSIRAPAPAPAPPANRISSRRHCVPATLKRIRFSRCENDAFLPRARPAPTGRGRIARRRTPTDPIPTLSLHFYHITTSPTTTNRTRRPTNATTLTDPVHRLSLSITKCSNSITVDKFLTRSQREELLTFHAAMPFENYLYAALQ